jgi:AbrB family looped-hinge helix DNA binding protein
MLYLTLVCKAEVIVREVKLSAKNQIVVPREAREALGAKPGSRLLVVVRNDAVILLAKPKDYAKAIRGLAGNDYPKDYLRNERDSWKS